MGKMAKGTGVYLRWGPVVEPGSGLVYRGLMVLKGALETCASGNGDF
jgi:hypothetical protein